LLLNGCTSLLVGGNGVGGYALGKDKGTVDIITDDVTMTASIKSALIKDREIDAFNIKVGTYRGFVTLHGHVKTSAQAMRAVQLTKSIDGVIKVTSKLLIIK